LSPQISQTVNCFHSALRTIVILVILPRELWHFIAQGLSCLAIVAALFSSS